jgi:hypothetical protein
MRNAIRRSGGKFACYRLFNRNRGIVGAPILLWQTSQSRQSHLSLGAPSETIPPVLKSSNRSAHLIGVGWLTDCRGVDVWGSYDDSGIAFQIMQLKVRD